MSTQSEINRIKNAKTAIANAIMAKGVAVPSGTKIDGMASLIAAIPSKEEIMLSFFPVGAITMNTTGTNPSEYIGGTWELWCKGRTIVGLGTVEANTKTDFGNVTAGELDWITPEAKGGEYKHTLTTEEMPAHSHKDTHGSNTTGTAWVGAKGTSEKGSSYTTNAGGDKAHNNIMPYQTCYIWKRTA